MRSTCIGGGFFFGGMGQIAHMTDKYTLVLQSCTVALRVEHGLCRETSVQSSDESNDIITVKIVGEAVHIKEEVEPIALSFSSIKDEPVHRHFTSIWDCHL